jgi:aminoglycoside 3-N-acetyltransferase
VADLSQLADLLAGLGVRRGGVVMVHASLRGTGLRATNVRDALLEVLGPDGTLVVPTFTPENSFTSRAYKELTDGMSAPEEAAFRASRPPFDPERTPCPTMGALAECVRTTRGAVRSGHPHTSLTGLGHRAGELLGGHDPHCHLGERSPLAKLYAADAQVLLLRVGFEVCSAFHLAEYRLRPAPARRTYHCVVGTTGRWTAYEDLTLYDGDFGAIGALLPRDLVTEREMAGKAVRLFGMREAVDLAGVQMCRAGVRMSGYRHGLT